MPSWEVRYACNTLISIKTNDLISIYIAVYISVELKIHIQTAANHSKWTKQYLTHIDSFYRSILGNFGIIGDFIILKIFMTYFRMMFLA